MRIFDTLHLSVESFRNRKSRTFLTILGVSIGIGAVLFLVSLGYGLQKLMLEQITTAEALLTLDVAASGSNTIPLNDQAVAKMKNIEHVAAVSPQGAVPAEIHFNNLDSQITANIIDQDYLRLNGVEPLNGTDFNSSTQNQVVINIKVISLFNLTAADAVGKTLTVSLAAMDKDGKPFNYVPKDPLAVVGVVDLGDDPQIFLLRSEFPDLNFGDYQYIKVKVNDSKYLETVRESLLGLGFLVSAVSDIVDQANKIFGVIQIILGVFGVIAVVVAAIGLANTMTISLLERTQDIGVMRSIGASSSDIRNLFLIESTVIGFSGGVLGIVLSYVASFLANFGMKILALSLGGKPVNLFFTPYWFLLFIIMFSTAVGLITGFFPARRAGKLKPLDALRYK